jgi:hypothetical protein
MTRGERLCVLLSVLNVILLGAVLAERTVVDASQDAPILRGRGLELVDGAGRTRAQFTIEPDGEGVFRIRDAAGTIRVKLGAGPNGSGLLLLDETTEPGVHLIARRASTSGGTTTSISLSGGDGKRRLIMP